MEQYIHLLPFSLSVVWWGLFLVVLLILSALVSGSEGAFFSLTPNDVGKIKKSQSSAALATLKLLSMQDYLLATILIANNLVNICAIIVANRIIDMSVAFGSAVVLEFVVKTIVVTFILLLFGEIMPKIVATANPLKFTRIVSMPILYAKSIFKPLSYVLINSSSRINEAVSKRKGNISMDEISDALEIANAQSAEDKKILTGIVNFINTEVSDVMRPRVDVVAIDVDQNYEQVKEIIMKSGFSRIPVYDEDLDNIRGVLYVKDLIPYITKVDFQWQNILREAYFVPDHKKINDLLEEFQKNKVHLAIVVDEYGAMQGVISMEDILEEIVGEISDESDLEESYYVKVDNSTYVFEGKTHLNDFLRVLSLSDELLDDSKGEAETLAGYMLEVKRDFLKVDDVIRRPEFSLQVLSMDGRRIKKIKVITPKE